MDIDITDKTENKVADMGNTDSSFNKSRETRKRRIGWLLLLFFCVSLTSCLIGFVIGRIVTTDNYSGYLVDTITLSSGEADIKNRFDLTGRVLYTDGTPYANGTVELRSEPRYTETDSSGYFMFKDVPAGKHVINVIQGGVVQATCIVFVDANESNTESLIVKLDDGSFQMRISLNVVMLEITLFIDNGKMIPYLSDDHLLGDDGKTFPGDAYGEDNNAEPEGTDETEPPVPPVIPELPIPPVIPEPPKPPVVPEPPITETPDRAPDIEASENVAGSQSWTRLASINIFGIRENSKNIKMINGQKVIAPGAYGSYPFKLKNNEANTIEYSISFSKADENQLDLPIKYRLKKGNTYIDGNQWQNAEDIRAEISYIQPGVTDYYTLEWKWSTSDDISDTLIGMRNDNKLYLLTAKVNAQFK